MSRPLLLVASLATCACVAILAWRRPESSFSVRLPDTATTPPEAAPLCPWREPETDLKAFFPLATRYEVETRILSGLRLDLQKRLGRFPTGDENAVRLYRAYRNETPLGAISTRRVKGEYGAIELVLAINTNRDVCGLRLQRLREPEPVANALQNSSWQSAFLGKRAEDPWRMGNDIPQVAAEARGSAGAVVEGARSLLILLAMAERAPAPNFAEAHHH